MVKRNADGRVRSLEEDEVITNTWSNSRVNKYHTNPQCQFARKIKTQVVRKLEKVEHLDECQECVGGYKKIKKGNKGSHGDEIRRKAIEYDPNGDEEWTL